MFSEGRVRRVHTHTLYILPVFMDVSLHRYPFVILIPLFFCLNFYFFLWIQTGFEAKAALDPSRLVNLPTNLPVSTSNFTITLKKIYTDIPLELPKYSNTPFTRFQRCSLTETGRWKEIFFHERKLEKRFAGPEIKMPHMRTRVLQPL